MSKKDENMNFNNPKKGYSDAQINAMEDELFGGRLQNLEPEQNDPNFKQGQAILQLMMEGIMPEAKSKALQDEINQTTSNLSDEFADRFEPIPQETNFNVPVNVPQTSQAGFVFNPEVPILFTAKPLPMAATRFLSPDYQGPEKWTHTPEEGSARAAPTQPTIKPDMTDDRASVAHDQYVSRYKGLNA